MKKILIPLFAIVVLATSCADKNAYIVTGHVTDNDFDSAYVYLKEVREDLKKDPSYTPATLDSTVVLNGSFTLKGLAPVTTLQMVVFERKEGERISKSILFVAEPGDIHLSLDTISTSAKGTPINDDYQGLINKLKTSQEKKRDLYTQYQQIEGKDKELEELINLEYKELEAQEQEAMYAFTKANITNPMGVYLLQRNSSMFKAEQVKDLLSALPAEKKTYERIARLDSYVKAIENTAEGRMFVDIKGKDPKGKDIALSEYAGKGKYVLVDFWASWCGPCRDDMPELVKLYDKYKGKGFEIVGVSLDRDEASWLASLKSMNMTWPQITTLKFWETQGAQDYGVNLIPHTVLIDKDGKIIARGLRGEDLADKLAELMK